MLEMQIVHKAQFVSIKVIPTNDEDLVPVALVQALLSGGLTRIIRDAGRHAELRIGETYTASGFTDDGGTYTVRDFTLDGLKAQIFPLLPFASQYIPGDPTVKRLVEEWMVI